MVAIPLYFGTMGAEYVFLKRRPDHDEDLSAARSRDDPDGSAGCSRPGSAGRRRDMSAGRYERNDTTASLTMGVASLIAPLVVPRLLRPFVPGRGRYGKGLVVTTAGAAVVTTVCDRLARLDGSARRRRIADAARRVAAVGGQVSVVTGGTALTTFVSSRTSLSRMWHRRVVGDLGTGPAALAAATLGWDFIYYWNHRLMHECRALWAIHVVHHSSEKYNLSTALRQPVAESFGVFVPYSLLCLFGIRPSLVSTARGVNLLYQYWIHTETVGTLGAAESALNTPSHHRVHHGSNGRYLDRNHGSILIVWDRLFGTFEPESEKVVYGLRKNIDTFNPVRIATHEYAEMLKDVGVGRTWGDRVGFVLRGPGWATRRRAELARSRVGAPASA